MDYKDIEKRVSKNEQVEKIYKSIEKRREKYNQILKYLDAGFDITTGEEIYSKEVIEMRKKEEREKFYTFLEKKQNQLVEIDSDIYEIEVEDEMTEDEEIRIVKKKKMYSVQKVALYAIINALSLAAVVGVTKYILHSDEVNRKTSKYAKELEEVVDNATYSRIGNLVYQNGEVVEVLDEDQTANHEYTYIDYNDIASYIENSDNPDLAAFTLYKNFGRTNNPEYHRIVTKTFKTLEFDGSKLGSKENFNTYLESNGYDSYEDYYNESRKELFTDGDSILDNIKVKIKKMTK